MAVGDRIWEVEVSTMSIFQRLSAGILLGAGLMIPASAQFNLEEERARGQFTACSSNLKSIATACEMYSTDHGGRYPKSLSQLTTRSTENQWPYLKEIPTCSAAGRDTYSEGYRMTAAKYDKNRKHVGGQDSFFFCCKGHHHKSVKSQPNRPAYDSNEGLLVK